MNISEQVDGVWTTRPMELHECLGPKFRNLSQSEDSEFEAAVCGFDTRASELDIRVVEQELLCKSCNED